MFLQWALLMSEGHLFLFLAVSVFDVVLCTFVSSVYIWRSVAPVQLNLIALNASLTIIIIIIIIIITIINNTIVINTILISRVTIIMTMILHHNHYVSPDYHNHC